MIATLRAHLARVFGGEAVDIYYDEGPPELPKGFCVLRFAPTAARPDWIYATCGMSQPPAAPVEVYAPSPIQDDPLVETLALLAVQHRAKAPVRPGALVGAAHVLTEQPTAPPRLSTEGRTVRFLCLSPLLAV